MMNKMSIWHKKQKRKCFADMYVRALTYRTQKFKIEPEIYWAEDV